jgi:outer membrane biosynthesis protein TonB
MLDRAVEKVAKTWKIFIYQNGLPVSGKVSVTYDFELKSKK